jgi:hypothetical protein
MVCSPSFNWTAFCRTWRQHVLLRLNHLQDTMLSQPKGPQSELLWSIWEVKTRMDQWLQSHYRVQKCFPLYLVAFFPHIAYFSSVAGRILLEWCKWNLNRRYSLQHIPPSYQISFKSRRYFWRCNWNRWTSSYGDALMSDMQKLSCSSVLKKI